MIRGSYLPFTLAYILRGRRESEVKIILTLQVTGLAGVCVL